jgi:acyl-CoA thioester hydrolase
MIFSAMMNNPAQPAIGHFEGDDFIFPVRVYYEDTDALNMVYYARYMNFCERARSNWLTHPDYDGHIPPISDTNRYVVKRVEMDYFHPARLFDDLLVRTHVISAHGARVRLKQGITRDNQPICQSIITLAHVDSSGRPKRLDR